MQLKQITKKGPSMSIHSGSRQILIHGMALVMVGLLWGLVVPATPHPRLALGAHIQFETNGMLFIVLALHCWRCRTLSGSNPCG